MALKSIEELKDSFENKKIPTNSNFLDFLDNCYNNSVSGVTVFNDLVTFKQYVKCNKLVIFSENKYPYSISVDNSGNIFTTPL